MISRTLVARVVPPSLYGGKGARRILERNLVVYRKLWVIIFSGFFEPLFYLFSIGIGIGLLVGDLTLPNGDPVPYEGFVAPALLASSTMNGAVYESTFNIFFKLKASKVYQVVLSTPMKPIDIAVGEITWSLIRGSIYAVGFLLVMWLLQLFTSWQLLFSWWAVLSIPGALLIGFAFASVGLTATTFMKSWQDFDLVQLVTLPLFLFSATFYPLSVYPGWLQLVAQLSPLYHGVELLRALTLGLFDWSLVGHIGFLLAMGAFGVSMASRRLAKLLLT